MSATVYFSYGDAPCLQLHRDSSNEDPQTEIILQYLNEGGANFVFRILPGEDGVPVPAYLSRQLLRLRKDLPGVPSTEDQMMAYHVHFQPLFSEEHLIQYAPISLYEGVSERLNDVLRGMDRPSHRMHDFTSEGERHGVLVTDMTPGPDEILLQVKPKWLTQSQNAPANAQRCRTCALRAQRASKKIRTATDKQDSCPLDLVSPRESDRSRAAQGMTDNARLQKYLMDDAQAWLKTLRDNQQRFDRHGVLSAQAADVPDLCKAMTIRDCTLFLRLSGDQVEGRLADMDLKWPHKLGQWKQVETDLIDGGWYTNSEESAHWNKESICLLSRD